MLISAGFGEGWEPVSLTPSRRRRATTKSDLANTSACCTHGGVIMSWCPHGGAIMHHVASIPAGCVWPAWGGCRPSARPLERTHHPPSVLREHRVPTSVATLLCDCLRLLLTACPNLSQQQDCAEILMKHLLERCRLRPCIYMGGRTIRDEPSFSPVVLDRGRGIILVEHCGNCSYHPGMWIAGITNLRCTCSLNALSFSFSALPNVPISMRGRIVGRYTVGRSVRFRCRGSDKVSMSSGTGTD